MEFMIYWAIITSFLLEFVSQKKAGAFELMNREGVYHIGITDGLQIDYKLMDR